MTITQGVYTTRETVKRALDISETARNNKNIDRAIESAARRIDGLCHRIFYPRVETKYFNWPDDQHRGAPWRLWLDDMELISVSEISSGGVVIPDTDYNLEPQRTGPPYNRVEINLGTSSSFSSGTTFQQAIAVTGLWGYTDDQYSIGTVSEALDASETSIDVDAAAASEIGAGSMLTIGTERMLVTNRQQLYTGQTLGGPGLNSVKNDVTVPVADGTQFAVDEIITIDAERMLIVDITGNNLTVIRQYDGTVMATHAPFAAIYAPRTITVRRGAFGTTAASHSNGSTITEWVPPTGIKQLNNTEAIHELLQEQAGWFRTMSASSNFGGTARRAASMESIVDLRDNVYREYGRKARTRTI